MIYEVGDMIDDSSGRGKDTKLSGIILALFEMIYEVDDMIDDSNGRGKDTKLSGIILALFVCFGDIVVGLFGREKSSNLFGDLQTG